MSRIIIVVNGGIHATRFIGYRFIPCYKAILRPGDGTGAVKRCFGIGSDISEVEV